MAESESLWRSLLFDSLRPSVGTRALLMSTFVQAGRCDLCLELLFDARLAGDYVPPDMMRGAVAAAAKAGRWALALELLEEMLLEVKAKGTRRVVEEEEEDRAASCQSAPQVGSGAVSIQNKHPNEVVSVTNNPASPNGDHSPDLSIPLITFNAVISSLSKAGQWRLALCLFRCMLSLSVAPDLFTWSALSSALAREGDLEQVQLLGEEMQQQHGLRPSLVVCNCVLLACQRGGRWREAEEQLRRMERMGVRPDVRSYASAIVACEGAGEQRVLTQEESVLAPSSTPMKPYSSFQGQTSGGLD